MYNKDYCVICAKHIDKEKVYSDLGSFNSVICVDCKDTDEANKELGLE